MSLRRLLPLVAALLLPACATVPETGTRVAVPLFRDPVHDGAADPLAGASDQRRLPLQAAIHVPTPP